MKLLLYIFLAFTAFANADDSLLEKNRKILVLGDSITQGGGYVVNFDTWLVKKYPERRYVVVNAGVASETVSGLSEDGHAGGRFPRPDLMERLERVLSKTKPELIISCYGMNCGIYLPLDKDRFESYKNGQKRLKAAAEKHGAQILFVTPPFFDNHGAKGFNYNSVLTAYSAWLVEQRKQGWNVADLHTDMEQKILAKKKANPAYTVQGDRIHPNAQGHWMMAQSLISYFGDAKSASLASPDLLLNKKRSDAIHQRLHTYSRAIHAETKPLRPGVPSGGTMQSAAVVAKSLEPTIYAKPHSFPKKNHLLLTSGYTLKFSSDSGNSSATDKNHLLNAAIQTKSFAFHTKRERRPYVQIDLDSVKDIAGAVVQNRPDVPQRAKNLAMAVSLDGKQWNNVWAANGQAQTEWRIDLTNNKSAKAKYIRFFLDQNQPEHLHLKSISLYVK